MTRRSLGWVLAAVTLGCGGGAAPPPPPAPAPVVVPIASATAPAPSAAPAPPPPSAAPGVRVIARTRDLATVQLDRDFVVWIGKADGSDATKLMRAPIAGGQAEEIATVNDGAIELGVAADAYYVRTFHESKARPDFKCTECGVVRIDKKDPKKASAVVGYGVAPFTVARDQAYWIEGDLPIQRLKSTGGRGGATKEVAKLDAAKLGIAAGFMGTVGERLAWAAVNGESLFAVLLTADGKMATRDLGAFDRIGFGGWAASPSAIFVGRKSDAPGETVVSRVPLTGDEMVVGKVTGGAVRALAGDDTGLVVASVETPGAGEDDRVVQVGPSGMHVLAEHQGAAVHLHVAPSAIVVGTVYPGQPDTIVAIDRRR